MESEMVTYTVYEDYVVIVTDKLISDDVVGKFEHALISRAPAENKHVLLDFRNVSAITSRGISAIIICKKKMKETPYLLGISNLRKEIRNLLSAMSINRIVPFFKSNEAFEIAMNEYEPERKPEEQHHFWCQVREHTRHVSLLLTRLKSKDGFIPVESFRDKRRNQPIIISLDTITSLSEDAVQCIFTLLENRRENGQKVVFAHAASDIIDLIRIVSDVPFEQADTLEEAEKRLLK